MTCRSTLITVPFVVLFAVSSCVRDEFSKLIDQGSCEEAATKIPGIERMNRIADAPGATGGTVAKYVVQGGAYVGDAALMVFNTTTGVITSVASCSAATFLIFSAVGRTSTEFCSRSIDLTFHNEKDAHLRDKAQDATADWGKTDLTDLSRSLRSLSSCHGKHGRPDLARAQIEALKAPGIYTNVSVAERIKIDDEAKALQEEKQP